MGLGHLGFPGDGFLGGFGAGAAALAWMGYWWLLDAVSLAAACGAAGDACAGGRRLPAWRPHCSGVGPGGGFGDLGRSASGLGLRLGLGGLGPGWCAAGSMGWCMRLGPALVWGSSLHRCLRRVVGPIEAGKRALPGCLIVLCSLGTDWMMGWGSFSSAVGSGGPPRAAMGPGLDGPGPPALGRFGVTGVPMGVSGGAGSRGGVFCPLWCFPPHP